MPIGVADRDVVAAIVVALEDGTIFSDEKPSIVVTTGVSTDRCT